MSDQPGSFLEFLPGHASTRADAPAYRLAGPESDMVLDYSTLAHHVARLGEGLRAASLGEGARVAICMENRPAWPVGYLAIWYAGATVVPIDPALEPHAIRRILEHSEVPLVLSSHRLGAKLLAAREGLDSPPQILDVDADEYYWDGDAPENFPAATGDVCGLGWTSIAPEEPNRWDPQAQAESPATIMYTSGTTGLPKGVVLSHGALFENVVAGLARIDLGERDHILGVLPLFHALPLMTNFLAPMVVGAQVTYLTELNPERIIAAFPRFGITFFACVPLFFYRFHDRVMKRMTALTGLRGKMAFAMLRINRAVRGMTGVNLGKQFFAAAHTPFGPKLKTFVSGGAKFDPIVGQDFLDLGFTLIQGYGLTEASAGLTAHPAKELDATTVGRALDGVEVRVDKPDKDGIGEIIARGPNLMIGYFKNDEATAEVVRDGWIHTGDLGRLLPNGHLQVTGRAKDMIVLASGKNIYPEELEAYYGRSELIDEICVLGIDDPRRRGAERLHAIVVPDFDAARARGQVNLREEISWEIEGLGIGLPGPQRLTSLEIRKEPLPRTTTRKVKRFELKRDILERGNRADGMEPARTAPPEGAEDKVDEPAWAHTARSILAQHARVEGVARHQHLDIDLGMESLERVELQADLEHAFGIELPPEAGGEVQTVGDLLDLLGEHGAGDGGGAGRGADSWKRVLAETPPEVEPYLRVRRVSPPLIFLFGRCMRLVQWMIGFKVSGAENIPRHYPFILAPNHLSYTDAPILGIALPWRVFRRAFFVGYSAYFRGAILGSLARLVRTVPIDQNRNLEAAMQAAAAGIRRGMILGIFPEGGRSGDGSIKEFRRGAGILARELDTPIVPVGIWGTYEMWPREGRFRLHPAAVVFGKPISYPADGSIDPGEFMTMVRERVIELVAEAEKLGRGE